MCVQLELAINQWNINIVIPYCLKFINIFLVFRAALQLSDAHITILLISRYLF